MPCPERRTRCQNQKENDQTQANLGAVAFPLPAQYPRKMPLSACCGLGRFI